MWRHWLQKNVPNGPSCLGILSVLALVVVSSCMEPIGEFEAYRIIKNESSHPVELTVTMENVPTSYHMSPGDSLVLKGKCYHGPGIAHCSVGWEEIRAVSARLVFANEGELLYNTVHCDGGRNILGSIYEVPDCGYTERMAEERREYVYTITDKDYAVAKPVGGSI